MDTISIFKKEQNEIIQNLRKRTYKILFKITWKRASSPFEKPYKTIDNDFLESSIQKFCEENNIKLKKIMLYSCFSKELSYIKIYGTKSEQISLYEYLISLSQYLKVNNI